MLSSDDDMRPYALVEDSPESLGEDEVCHGRLYKAGQNGYTRKSFDIVASFLDVLGKSAAQVPGNYERGELLMDTAMDLETNATKGLTRENSLILQHGSVPDNAIVKMAQTFRSGTNDIDALDYVDMFLADEEQTTLDELTEFYVLVNFRPVLTKKNWRMDSGVAGYDNTFGLPPFFPDLAALRGLHLPSVDPAGRRLLRSCRCRAEPHQEQLHAQSAGRGDLQ